MSKPAPTIDSKTQIHEGNIELSVFSCWTAKLLLRAKVDAAKIDPKGKFISIDIDDDETAKPEFAPSPTIDRAGPVKAVQGLGCEIAGPDWATVPLHLMGPVTRAKSQTLQKVLALLNAPSSQKETRT